MWKKLLAKLIILACYPLLIGFALGGGVALFFGWLVYKADELAERLSPTTLNGPQEPSS